MSNTVVTGIDIGTHETRVLVCELLEGQQTPRILGFGSAKTEGLRHGYVISRQLVAKTLSKAILIAEKNSGLKIKNAYLAMGGISLRSHRTTTTTTFPEHKNEVTERLVEQSLDECEAALLRQKSNIRILHTIPLSYKVDGEGVFGQPLGMKGKSLTTQALFVVCHDHHFEDFVSAAHDAGVDIIDVVAAPLVAGFSCLSHTDRMAGAGIIDLGAETLSIAVFENNKLISLEVFPIGSTDITNDIALGFKIPLIDAEAIKRKNIDSRISKQFTKTRLDQIIQARMSDIFELLEKHLKDVKRNHLLPAGIIFLGAGSTLDNLSTMAREYLKLPSRVVSSEKLRVNKRALPHSGWLIPFGLCMLVHQDLEVHYRKPTQLQTTFSETVSKVKSFFKQLAP